MKISSVSQFVLSLTLALALVSPTYAANGESEKTDKKAKTAVSAFDASLYAVVNTSKVKLAIDKISDASVKLVLKDNRGNVIYEETLPKNQDKPYRRVFDVEGMENGTYYFVMYNKDQKITKTLEIATSSTQIIVL